MTPKEREALKLALDALVWSDEYLETFGQKLFQNSKKAQPGSTSWHVKRAITAIREALAEQPAQPQQEPVAREHITDGNPCWCEPETNYTDPETGISVIVHKEPQ